MGLSVSSIKAGLQTWKKGWLSFVLVVIILSFAFVPLILISYIFLQNSPDIIGLLLFILLSFTLLIFYSLLQGIVQAIGNEVSEMGTGRAENITYYIKRNGKALIVAGIIISGLSLILSTPLLVIDNLSNSNMILGQPNQTIWIVTSITRLVITIIVNSIFSLAISAIIFNNLDATPALTRSFELFKKHYKSILFVVVIFESILWAIFSLLRLTVYKPNIQLFEVVFIIIISIMILFIVFPLMNLTYFHLYLKLTLPSVPIPETKDKDVPIKII